MELLAAAPRFAALGPLRPRSAALGAASGGDTPLKGLAGSALSRRFRHWRGASGRRYLFSIFPLDRPDALDEVPRFEDAVVLAVQRHGEHRRILAVDETGGLPDLFYLSAGFRQAVAAGANEIHVHLLTDRASDRAAVLRDLATS